MRHIDQQQRTFCCINGALLPPVLLAVLVQIIVGIIFCIGYLALIAFLTPYETNSDNLFSTVCQVQTLFVLLAALMVLMRNQIVDAVELIEKLNGSPMESAVADEQWFHQARARTGQLPWCCKFMGMDAWRCDACGKVRRARARACATCCSSTGPHLRRLQ